MTCEVLPARPSVPGCERCDLGRDGACALASTLGGGGRRGLRGAWRLPPGRLALARTVRGVLLAAPVLALGGLVEGDYVGATLWMWAFVPFIVGLACTAVIARGAAPLRSPALTALGALLGALAAAIGFWSAAEPYGPTGRWLPPLLAGAAGSLAWAWYDRPVQRPSR